MRYNVRHHQPLLSYGASGASFAASPSLSAPLQNTLVPTIALGTSTPTWTTTGAGLHTMSVIDWEGVLQRTLPAEALFTGSRRVQNLLLASVDISNAAWTKNNSGTAGALSPTVTTNFATDPLGGGTATRLQLNMGSDAVDGISRVYQQFQYLTAQHGATGAKDHRGSVWMKANTGTPTVMVMVSNSIAGADQRATFVLSSTWRRYTVPISTSPTTADTSYLQFGLYGTTLNTTGTPCSTTADILVWGAQLENVSGQSIQTPGEYVSSGVLSAPYHGAGCDGVKYFLTKNGNTVAANIITEATGADITLANGASTTSVDASGPFGLTTAYPRLNIITTAVGTTAAEIFTGASNISYGTAVASPLGDVIASSIVENNVTGQHRMALSGGRGTTNAADYCVSVFAKAAPGGRPRIDLAFSDGGGTNVCEALWTVATGANVVFTATGTTVAGTCGAVALANGWYRFWMTFNFSASSTFALNVALENGTSVSYTGTNGLVAQYWWGLQLVELSGGTGTPVATKDLSDPPIYSIQAGGYNVLTYPFASNASSTTGTAYMELKNFSGANPSATGSSRQHLMAFTTDSATPGAPGYLSAGEAMTTVRMHDGTNAVQKTGLSTFKGTFRKFAASWSGSAMQLTSGGSTVATGTFDGAMGSTAIGVGNPTTDNTITWYGHIRNVKCYTVSATAAELASLTA
jgi:hypothetical protein